MSTALHQTERQFALPAGQQMVLLMLLRDSLSKQVLPLLHHEAGVDKPASADWALLIQSRLVKKGTHWFLTQAGRLQAERVAKAIARHHGIHHVTESEQVAGCPLRASCTCGWNVDAPRSWNGQARLNAHITGHLARIDRDRVLKEAHDVRIEPNAPLDGLSPSMRSALLDLASGALTRFDPGYARKDERNRPTLPYHAVVTINALAERDLVRRFVLIGTGGKEGEAHLTGQGAWVVRTLRRSPRDA